ncbi:hypothetical protein FE784_20935 [Paenibacillus hemerocallicola]|uniref:DNA mismatch repair proteins mutS family domain-containing protein n=1 Tax=Paenibacillus hemerocallicola TaxID=1172614 RepID=A0A5C4T7I3_9BACL|nr:hypothetical protein [Paenibacillus hemerocallicola]TNJ64259.1 hypothetical protein FE784_20935 [Paenibacillus hemerocallicola]
MVKDKAASLLWPSETSRNDYKDVIRIEDQAVTDLGLERIFQELSFNHKYYPDIKRLLLGLCDDPDVIRYRLDILDDVMHIAELSVDLERVLPDIHKLDIHYRSKVITGAEPLRKIAWQMEALEVYVQNVATLKTMSSKFKQTVKSEGLRRLFASIESIAEEDGYRALAAALPDYRLKLQGISSVTIGVNLDHELKPAEAIILSLDSKPFKNRKSSLLSSLFGMKSVEEPYEGISPFQNIKKLNHSALDTALLKSLEEVFNDALLPIGNAMKRFIEVNIPAITELEMEIGYYVGAAKFCKLLESAGLTMCKPELAPVEERICRIHNMIDVNLALGLTRQHPGIELHRTIVANDVEFGSDGRVFILTGPNQGGKTTYTRAIGVAQILCQAGLFVPGSRAVLSPVDGLYTHFSEEEKPNIDNGRLGEESRRLHGIFMNATRHSLILLNESLSSTSSRDSLYVARDIVKAMKVLGCRAVYATHLLELAAGVDQINAELPGDDLVISMVAGVERERDEESRPGQKARRTYKIKPGPPNEMSFAKDIARLYGISFDQIVQTLKERNVIDR